MSETLKQNHKASMKDLKKELSAKKQDVETAKKAEVATVKAAVAAEKNFGSSILQRELQRWIVAKTGIAAEHVTMSLGSRKTCAVYQYKIITNRVTASKIASTLKGALDEDEPAADAVLPAGVRLSSTAIAMRITSKCCIRAFEYAGFDEFDQPLQAAAAASLIAVEDKKGEGKGCDDEGEDEHASPLPLPRFCSPITANATTSNFVVALNVGDHTKAQSMADQLNVDANICEHMAISVSEDAGASYLVGTFKPTSRFCVQVYTVPPSECSLVSQYHLSKDVDANNFRTSLNMIVRYCRTSPKFHEAFFRRASTASTTFQEVDPAVSTYLTKQEVLSAVISWLCLSDTTDDAALKTALEYMDSCAKKEDGAPERAKLTIQCDWWVADLPRGDEPDFKADMYRKQYGLAKTQQTTTLVLECLRPLLGVVLALHDFKTSNMFESIKQGFASAGPSNNNVNDLDEYAL
jgi:hypothetical protein